MAPFWKYEVQSTKEEQSAKYMYIAQTQYFTLNEKRLKCNCTKKNYEDNNKI